MRIYIEDLREALASVEELYTDPQLNIMAIFGSVEYEHALADNADILDFIAKFLNMRLAARNEK